MTAFAYILDQGASSAATVSYGKGVVSVDDPAGDSSYTVHDRCAVLR